MSDALPATDRVLRSDVVKALRGSQEKCMCHEKNVVQMTTYLEVAPPTDDEVNRLARCLWDHDGMPAGMYDKPSVIAQFVNPTTRAQKTAVEMVDRYRSDARKMLVVLQQGGNFDAE